MPILSASQAVWEGHRATSKNLDAGKGFRVHLIQYPIFIDEETEAHLCSGCEDELWSYTCQSWLLP